MHGMQFPHTPEYECKATVFPALHWQYNAFHDVRDEASRARCIMCPGIVGAMGVGFGHVDADVDVLDIG